MNVFHKIARESLRKNRTRTFVTVIGVMLSAALITGVMSFGNSLLTSLAQGTAARYGDWHIALEGVDEAFISEQRRNPDVADVIAFDEMGIVSQGGDANGLRLVGFTQETFRTLPLTVISGRLPRSTNELLLRDGAYEAAVGDTLTLFAQNGTAASYTVVGICAHPSFVRKDAGWHFAVTYLENTVGTAAKTAFVKLNNPYTIRSYREGITQSSYYNNKLLRFLGIWEDSHDSLIITLMLSISIVVIAIIMTGSVFLIFNAFHISLNERTHQIGLLASVGATPKQIKNSVLYEGFCIGLIGIPLGALVGLGAVRLVIATTADSFADIFPLGIRLQLCLSPFVIIAAVAVSFVTILISAHIPAKKAANVPVIDCIRQTGEIKLNGKSVKTSKFSQWLLGFEGMLALKNFKRNKRQYRSVILSLVLSIVLFISTSTFTDCLTAIADDALMVTDYEVGFGTMDMDDATLLSLFEQCADLDAATKCSLKAEYIVPVVAQGSAYTASVQFVDEQSYRAYVAQCGLDASAVALPTLAKQNNKNADSISELTDMFQTESLSAKLGNRPIDLVCVEQLMPDVPPTDQKPEELPYTFQILAPWSMMQMLPQNASLRVKGITVCSDEPAKAKAELQSIVESNGIVGKYWLVDCTEILNSNNSMVFVANLFSYTFIVMITLIAIANVFNTISTNIKLRRRELAMIRSLGMGNRSFRKMMRFECVFYGLRAMLFGIPLSLFLSYQIQKTMLDGVVDKSTSWFQVPWVSIAIGTWTVLLIVFLTMMYTVNSIKRENIIDALRDELA